MNRDELVEIAWQAWLGAGPTARDGVVDAVDAVEPIIRADERDEADHRLRMRIHEINDQMTEVRAAIEAEVRKRIVQEIVLDRLALTDVDLDTYSGRDIRIGLSRAERIARGDT